MPAIVWIALFIVPAWLALKKDFKRGLCVSLGLFASMPSTLSLPLGGAFEMTSQRILLIVVTLYWIPWLKREGQPLTIPFKGLIVAWWVVNVLSLFVAVDASRGVKWFVSFSTEMILFYIIVSSALTDKDTVLGAVRAFAISGGVLGVLGVIEYYKEFNPVLDWMGIAETKDANDVIVTFRHRILFGYCMGMSWPLLLAMTLQMKKKIHMIVAAAVIAMMVTSCYFSNSRGPWTAAALSGIALYIFGTAQARRCLQVMAVLAVVVVIVRPGIRATLVDLVASTFDSDSYRGRSYAYRKELWPAAFRLTKESPIRFAVGHGGLSTETMDLYDQFEFGGNTVYTGYSSWDNNYAADLVEFGYAGLIVEAALLAAVLLALFRSALEMPPEYKNFSAAVLGAVLGYVWALSNVYMFSPQLKCLFFALVVIGVRLPVVLAQSAQAAAEPVAEEILEDEPVIAAKPG